MLSAAHRSVDLTAVALRLGCHQKWISPFPIVCLSVLRMESTPRANVTENERAGLLPVFRRLG